jgi:hypothetical protein
MAGTEKLFMMTEERRIQLLAGFDRTKMMAGEAPLWTDARSAPLHFQIRIAEIREAISEKRAVQGDPRTYPAPSAEYRAAAQLAQRAVRFVKNVFTSNADLHAQADRIARQIKRDEAHARAEAERKFFETASPAELLKALEAKIGKREQPGAALAPGAPCCTACTPDQHAKAATYHRTKAANAASWQEGAAHHSAADSHAKAAEQFNADNSVAARSASQKVEDEYGDDEDEDNF